MTSRSADLRRSQHIVLSHISLRMRLSGKKNSFATSDLYIRGASLHLPGKSTGFICVSDGRLAGYGDKQISASEALCVIPFDARHWTRTQHMFPSAGWCCQLSNKLDSTVGVTVAVEFFADMSHRTAGQTLSWYSCHVTEI
jgi:hypothetical protein